MTRVAIWPDGEGFSQRASQFSPHVTASDVPALNLLQLPSTSHYSCHVSYRSVLAGRRCIILALLP